MSDCRPLFAPGYFNLFDQGADALISLANRMSELTHPSSTSASASASAGARERLNSVAFASWALLYMLYGSLACGQTQHEKFRALMKGKYGGQVVKYLRALQTLAVEDGTMTGAMALAMLFVVAQADPNQECFSDRMPDAIFAKHLSGLLTRRCGSKMPGFLTDAIVELAAMERMRTTDEKAFKHVYTVESCSQRFRDIVHDFGVGIRAVIGEF